MASGSRLSFSLPPVEGDVILETKPGLPKSLPSGTETILLVDDEPAVRSLARQVLQTCGYQVLEAKDGQDALREFASFEEPIHILVTDVAMPNLGGLELAKRLRERIPTLKVLFVSGYADDVLLQQGLSEEGISFLHKPYSPFVLASKVRDILANKSGVITND